METFKQQSRNQGKTLQANATLPKLYGVSDGLINIVQPFNFAAGIVGFKKPKKLTKKEKKELKQQKEKYKLRRSNSR